MKILAFDGTAKAASVAVADGDRILAHHTVDNGLTQSELLLPMAEDMLKSLKLSFSDIELYATSVGPGSFTGVRIGVSLIKGLAFGKNIPCVGVSTIEALAENLKGRTFPNSLTYFLKSSLTEKPKTLYNSGKTGIYLTDLSVLVPLIIITSLLVKISL